MDAYRAAPELRKTLSAEVREELDTRLRIFLDATHAGSPPSMLGVLKALAAGADPNVRLADGTPGLHAATAHATSYIPAFLAAGADVHATDKDGNTCLHHACSIANVTALCAAGANPLQPNNAGILPADCLRWLATEGSLKNSVDDPAVPLTAITWMAKEREAGTLTIDRWADYWEEQRKGKLGLDFGKLQIVRSKTFPYFLDALAACGETLTPDFWKDHPHFSALMASIARTSEGMAGWLGYCDQQGTPFTAEHAGQNFWIVMESHSAFQYLFEEQYWRDQPDLSRMVELFNAMPAVGQRWFESRPHIHLPGKLVNEWLEGAGKDCSASALRAVYNGLPDFAKPQVKGYHQQLQMRQRRDYSAVTANMAGRE